jgi:sporulation-control protein spo0M
MGGQQGKAQIQIVLNQNSITDGDQISGSVNLIIGKEFQNVDILFKLIGKEAYLSTKDNERNSGKVFILNHKSILHETRGGVLRKGNYSFPFAINTPETIPGTFYSKSGDYEAKIGYVVKSCILEKNKDVIAKYKTPLTVKQIINADRYSMLFNQTAFINCCDCFNKGNSTIRVHLNKNAFLPEETASLWIEIDNASSRSKMKAIKLKLFQYIRLLPNDYKLPIMFKKKLWSIKKGFNLKPGNLLLKDKSITVEFPIKFKKTDLLVCPTTDGKLIQCKYELEVSSIYGLCISPGPIVEIPLLIFPEEKIFFQPSAPEEWDPVEMPLSQFNLA